MELHYFIIFKLFLKIYQEKTLNKLNTLVCCKGIPNPKLQLHLQPTWNHKLKDEVLLIHGGDWST
jgi:hypothetical protein